MTTPIDPTRRISIRALSNIVAFIALLLAVDWGIAWLRGAPTFTCAAAHTLGLEGILPLAGMGGLAIAILGITVGGVRHPMTALGLVVMVAGLLGGALLGDAVPALCG
jgi:hypothetical protein